MSPPLRFVLLKRDINLNSVRRWKLWPKGHRSATCTRDDFIRDVLHTPGERIRSLREREHPFYRGTLRAFTRLSRPTCFIEARGSSNREQR